jgi:hypothetical protein
MAKFSQNTLNQVAGFDGQVIAQELVYDQKEIAALVLTFKSMIIH